MEVEYKYLPRRTICYKTKRGHKSFLDINIRTTERLATVWDTLKAYIRGRCMAYSSWKKKESKEKVQLLEKDIIKLEKQLAQQYEEDKFRKICQLTFKLHEMYNKKAEYALFRLKTNFHETGEKTGKLLARQLKHQDANNVITAIRKEDKVITSSKEINTVFKEFQSRLVYIYMQDQL